MLYTKGVNINDVKLGSGVCPSKIIRVQPPKIDRFIQIFYDTGSHVTYCNKYYGPIATWTHKDTKTITISSLTSKNPILRNIHT